MTNKESSFSPENPVGRLEIRPSAIAQEIKIKNEPIFTSPELEELFSVSGADIYEKWKDLDASIIKKLLLKEWETKALKDDGQDWDYQGCLQTFVARLDKMITFYELSEANYNIKGKYLAGPKYDYELLAKLRDLRAELVN